MVVPLTHKGLPISEQMKKFFLGVMSSADAASKVFPSRMRLYYRKDSAGIGPLKLPLVLVYKNSDGEAFHFPLRHSDEDGWFLDITPRGPKASTLTQLIMLYEEWPMRHPNQPEVWESFPVWEDEFAKYKT